jgi:O-antigen/teichoic acid export membrane protein
MIGVAIAVIGFVATILSGATLYTYQGAVVAGAVLLYGYPVRRSWEQAIRRFSPQEDEIP